MSFSNRRIIGLDFARALAVFGMVIVNFKIAMGAEANGPAWLIELTGLLSGKAAATFVILAGIGISLLTRKARRMNDQYQLISKRNTLLKRALFLFVAGLLYTPLWPADILHFYGIYIAVAALLLNTSSKKLTSFSLLLVTAYCLLILVFDYGDGWNWETLAYTDFWTPAGMVRHLFFNGFHPVIPWLAFLLLGMVIGRMNLEDSEIRKRILFWSASSALIAELLSRFLIRFLSEGAGLESIEITSALFGTGPMPPMPLYMFAGAGAGCTVIICSIVICEHFRNSVLVKSFVSTGQLALTLYLAHVVIGMGILEGAEKLENQTLLFSLLASAAFCAASVVFSYFWRKHFRRGPIEYAMRVITGG